MSDVSFKPGDRVQMKSGGPAMTVEKIDGDEVVCSWMQLKGKVAYDHKRSTFAAVTLVPYQRRAVGVTLARF